MNIARSVGKKPTIMIAIIFSFLLTWVAGCSNINKLGNHTDLSKQAAVNSTLTYIPLTITTIRHDTVKVPARRQMSAADLDAYMEKAYKKNFNEFFAPEFNKLIKSNQTLAITNNSILEHGRHKRDSIDSVANYWRSNYAKTQQQLMENSNKNTEQYERYLSVSDATVRTLNEQTNLLITLSILIIVAVICLFIYVNRWVKKVRDLQLQLQNE